MPLIARGPGIAPGSVCRVPVVGYDFLATFVDLVGGDTSQLPAEVDGASFKKLLSDPDAGPLARDTGGIIFHRPERLFSAIRSDDHKLMLFWKLDGTVRSRELYDVSENPTEEGRDIAAKQPEQAATMEQTLLGHLESVDAEKPKVRPPKRKKGPGKQVAR